MTITSICQLCRQDRALVKSHVISEFMYKGVYDKSHKIMVLDGARTNVAFTRQSGWWERLLCEECDNSFSSIETYVKDLLFGGPDIGVKLVSESPFSVTFCGVDYQKFKLFQMLTLWRAGTATGLLFKHVNLGVHEERLRLHLLHRDPGRFWEYGCTITIVTAPDGPFDTIRSPEPFRINGFQHYRFMFGGFIWTYVVASHSKQYRYAHLFLREDGTLHLYKRPLEEIGFLNEDRKHFRLHKSAVEDWERRRKQSKR